MSADAVRRRERYWADEDYRNEMRRRNREGARVAYANRREHFWELVGDVACERCGESRRWRLEFHHRDPREKLYKIGTLRNQSVSDEEILSELAKCIVLCANCHKDIHHEMDTAGTVSCPSTTTSTG